MEDALTQLTKKSDARVAQVTAEPLIGIIENHEKDHNLAFVWEALKRANHPGVCIGSAEESHPREADIDDER